MNRQEAASESQNAEIKRLHRVFQNQREALSLNNWDEVSLS